MRRRRFLALSGGVPAALLFGCGGGSDDTVSPTPDPATPAATNSPSATGTAATASPTQTTAPATATPTAAATPLREPVIEEFPVVAGSGPHDVAVQADGQVWYTGQRNGTMGLLDPVGGGITEVPLGDGSASHGVIIGPDGAAWVTDGGLNAIVRVDATTFEVTRFPLPGARANLNTAAFDGAGVLWYTGQNGYFGSCDPATGVVTQFASPRGPGPYGICATPSGAIYYASLAGSHIALVDTSAAGTATPIDPPTAGQGARRIWSDSAGNLWIAEWNAGQVGVYRPSDQSWSEWKLPGAAPQAYAVYVDERDHVWLTDFRANAIVRFDPATEEFLSLPLPKSSAAVRQLLGRPGEVWGAESSADALVVVRT